jgi:hypothetical protein
MGTTGSFGLDLFGIFEDVERNVSRHPSTIKAIRCISIIQIMLYHRKVLTEKPAGELHLSTLTSDIMRTT